MMTIVLRVGDRIDDTPSEPDSHAPWHRRIVRIDNTSGYAMYESWQGGDYANNYNYTYNSSIDELIGYIKRGLIVHVPAFPLAVRLPVGA